jgi:hypothetical protein
MGGKAASSSQDCSADAIKRVLERAVTGDAEARQEL